MIRLPFGGTTQDFYTYEPALLRGGRACVPYRWFIRNGRYFGLAYEMVLRVSENAVGWVVREDRQLEVSEATLSESLPFFEQTSASAQGLP